VTRRRPTDDDRHDAFETALNGLSHGDHLGDVAARLAPLHPRDNIFPGEVLPDLAADAIAASGANRQALLEFEGIGERYLPDGVARTKAQHHKSKYALRAPAMLHGGVDPGLLDEVQWWRTERWSDPSRTCRSVRVLRTVPLSFGCDVRSAITSQRRARRDTSGRGGRAVWRSTLK
jgi:hypothetical protein